MNGYSFITSATALAVHAVWLTATVATGSPPKCDWSHQPR